VQLETGMYGSVHHLPGRGVAEIGSCLDLPRHELLEIAEFFQYYMRMEENRETEVKGRVSKKRAFRAIEPSIRRHQKGQRHRPE